MIRIVFGVSNPHRLPSISSSTRLLTPLDVQTKIIESIVARRPDEQRFFKPVGQIYYDGPMGGYGANLKVRHVGYALEPHAISDFLALKQIPVPMISSKTDFEAFIASTAPMTRRVAVIQNHLLSSFAKDDVCAIVYEKRLTTDTLYLYHNTVYEVDFQKVQSYFRSALSVYVSTSFRTELSDISALYAIEDAQQLVKLSTVLDKDIAPTVVRRDSPIYCRATQYEFEVGPTFLYDDQQLMEAYFQSMSALLDRSSYPAQSSVL